MKLKRILLLAGHYGSGKTNIAVNMAMDLKRKGNETLIADIDIVNPYFRTKDSQKELEAAEHYARNRKAGLWSESDPEAPWNWRRKNQKK